MSTLVFSIALLAGCEFDCDEAETKCLQWDNAPVCNPGETQSCICETGAAGEEECLSNGLGYGRCECSIPADAGVDATTDASVDASVP